jgi:PAS domain S-box-containing protein
MHRALLRLMLTRALDRAGRPRFERSEVTAPAFGPELESVQQMPQETRFQELKRYVRFDAHDAELLLAFRGLAAPEFPRIAQEFYERIREHADAHELFADEEQIPRLQRSLILWMARIFGGVYDETYYEQTCQIGRVHVRIGLPQRFTLTAMALIRIALSRIADSGLNEDAAPTREAVSRILDLELAIMLETYKDAFVERIRQVERPGSLELGDALARAERRCVNAVESASVLIVGLDRGGHIQLFNREAERVTGFARDEVMGRLFSSVLSAEDPHGLFRQQLEESLAGNVPSRVSEVTLRTRAGKLRDLVWNLTFAGEPAGDEIVLFAVGRDLTDTRAMEVRARQAEKLAAVGTLAAGLAHEIRNPLHGAQLHLALLERAIREKANGPELLEATQVVAGEIKRLAGLLTVFLEFARPTPLQWNSISLVELCRGVVQRVGSEAESAGVAIACQLPNTDLEFQADYAGLTQVLLKLVQNAVQAAKANGGGGVVLRGRRGPQHVLIEVEDDGVGLPTPAAPIFDAFFSTKQGRAGLGLAIAHRIVSDHRGTLEASSKNGKTTFRLTLPLAQTTETRS